MGSALLSAGLRASTSHAPVLPERRLPHRQQRSAAVTVQDCAGDGSANPLVIRIPPPRPMQPMPSPVAVVHSPAYIYEMRTVELLGQSPPEPLRDSSPAWRKTRRHPSDDDFAGSALEWALARADESLYEMERNPNKATQVLWQASQSPVGEAAAAGVRGAAELTLSAGTNAIKIAGPISLWVIREGFKAAWNFMSVMASDSRRSTKRRLQEYEEWEDGRLQEEETRIGLQEYKEWEDGRLQEEETRIGEEN